MKEKTTSIGWHRSTRCSSGGCIEVNVGSSEVGVRDSKNPNSPILSFTTEAWRAFINAATNDDFGSSPS